MTEQRGGLFGKPKPQGEAGIEERATIDAANVTNLSRRVRVMEERFFNIQKQQQVNEESLLELSRGSANELKIIGKELTELKSQFIELRDKLERMSEQLETKASDSEFLVFKKYLELWRPVNFVTASEMERAIQEALGKKSKKDKA